MALYAIGDLHLSLGADKPMDIFPGWQGYVERLKAHWEALVQPQDTVVLAGDTSWAMQLQNTVEDFSFIQSLPGQKLILKGNHDYWWATRTKMEAWCAQNGFDSLHILHNNSVMADGMAVCGTRGWMVDSEAPPDQKVMNREAGRLRASLEDAAKQDPGAERVVFLHYPPLHQNGVAGDIVALLQEFGVRRCYYGHLHGVAIRYAVQGVVAGIDYKQISADALGFCPMRIYNNVNNIGE